MILSMTGYGKATTIFRGRKITAEIRSLNSKALDLTTRIAPLFREKEMEIRSLIATRLERGKVEFSLWVERDEVTNTVEICKELAGSYYRQIAETSKVQSIPMPIDPWQVILRMPDILTKQEGMDEITSEEWPMTLTAIEEAIDQLVEFRRQEGVALERKFHEKINNIERLMSSIEPYEKARTERIRQRLVDALSSIPEVDYDNARLEQEMIFYIEKLDISEEKQRLFNHVRYFRETMANDYGQGKKLGFIAQEMGREINTTGSKSNHAEMQNIVVRMKDELEQIKEQVLNVL